jgi:hypothetical protein
MDLSVMPPYGLVCIVQRTGGLDQRVPFGVSSRRVNPLELWRPSYAASSSVKRA